MKTLVFGSCNLDFNYSVPAVVAPGETAAVSAMHKSPGGKGLNQAIALQKAGLQTYFAGLRGPDGELLLQTLADAGVDARFFRRCAEPTGQAHIQVTPTGENAILLYRGANGLITREMIDDTLAFFGPGDLLVLQNEVSELDHMIEAGFRKGMKTVLNPSPISAAMTCVDYSKTDLVFMNEVELAGLSGGRGAAALIADMRKKYPAAHWVITLGGQGSLYFDAHALYRQPAFSVDAVDTTCAGDTFTGYFTVAFYGGLSPAEALRRASAAAAVTVSRMGAAGVIPTKEETEAFLSAAQEKAKAPSVS